MRRLDVTEGLLFAVLWGGNRESEGGKGSRARGGDEEEGDSGNNVREPCSVSLQTSTRAMPTEIRLIYPVVF